ncbi:MAG: hypothetical protein KF779_07350 [Hyphomonadaceae bacterium]|nr:hypothetical protein [Hyphomonadaceae bacterium]
MRTIFVIAAVMLMGCANVAAQQPQAACAGPEYRQMDFWVGVWDARWDASPSTPAGNGTNTITRTLDGCVIQEDFDGGPATGNLIGRSMSMYHAPLQRWRQTWVDNQGGYFALTGGPVGQGFVLENTRLSESAPYLRMVYEDITANAFTWRWQRSADQGATWTDSWVIHYTRRQE